MTDEFAARRVVTDVIAHLERRRSEIAGDQAAVHTEVERALAPVRAAYEESALPAAYLAALENEIREIVPGRWREAASEFVQLEARAFGSWRRGDVYARISYVFVGLLVGGLCLRLPFIPIWEKWFPFALGAGAWWLPDLQALWQRRGYARRLGEIVRDVSSRQRALEGTVTLAELAAPRSESGSTGSR